mmetsp:Transcript_30394/g.50286  ORF Transcript_30394/g.50286 Transcript_30394/m.50286 type:complete len:251 (-) Transcript_30394:725-1477(-)
MPVACGLACLHGVGMLRSIALVPACSVVSSMRGSAYAFAVLAAPALPAALQCSSDSLPASPGSLPIAASVTSPVAASSTSPVASTDPVSSLCTLQIASAAMLPSSSLSTSFVASSSISLTALPCTSRVVSPGTLHLALPGTLPVTFSSSSFITSRPYSHSVARILFTRASGNPSSREALQLLSASASIAVASCPTSPALTSPSTSFANLFLRARPSSSPTVLFLRARPSSSPTVGCPSSLAVSIVSLAFA